MEPFRTDNGEQLVSQKMTSYVVSNLRVAMIYEPPKKQNISVLLEITFSNSWQYEIFSLVDNVLANLIALT